ncbi:hypothetical protein LBMAG42_48680 [Deltaproteobacteria bacterium]|nr:hypothetical protein LBMAG42_48680 [Deltaproteobacteria bacterium]
MLLSLLVFACTTEAETGAADTAADTADSGGDSAATGPGTLAISVQMDDDMVADLAEDGESAHAMVSGSIYIETDVEAFSGPIEGAVSLGDFTVDVDLTPDGGPSAVIYTSEPIDPQIVYVLGCMDTDVDLECGSVGDPVTNPVSNKVIVVAEAETPFTMVLGLRRP